MGHHYRIQFTLAAVGAVADELALVSIHRTAEATSKPLFIWEVQLSLANGTAVAGNIVVRAQREATVLFSGGGAGVIAKVNGRSPDSGATVLVGAPSLTGTPTTAGRLASFGHNTAVLNSTSNHRLDFHRGPGDLWTPLCSVVGTEQFALVLDEANPAAASLITGSIMWEEMP